jgi:hypothetical protein
MDKKPLSKREQRNIEQKKAILKTWPDQREMGKKKYIFKFGFLNWGVSTFAIYSIFMMLLNNFTNIGQEYTLYQAVYSFLFFLIFGLFYSNATWNKNEKMFKEKFPYKK